MPTADQLNDLAYRVRGAGLKVHEKFGPGCFESAYAPCFAYELEQQRIAYRRKASLTLHYETVVIPRAYEIDFVIDGCIVTELKHVKSSHPSMRGSCKRT